MQARLTPRASRGPSAGSTAIMRALTQASATNARRIWGGFEDLGDVFADLMRQRAGGRGGGARAGAETHFRMRGGDAHYTLPIEFLEAVNGARKRVDMPGGKTLDVAIPAGVPGGPDAPSEGPGHGGGWWRAGMRSS